jgi:hypothetical protein
MKNGEVILRMERTAVEVVILQMLPARRGYLSMAV